MAAGLVCIHLVEEALSPDITGEEHPADEETPVEEDQRTAAQIQSNNPLRSSFGVRGKTPMSRSATAVVNAMSNFKGSCADVEDQKMKMEEELESKRLKVYEQTEEKRILPAATRVSEVRGVLATIAGALQSIATRLPTNSHHFDFNFQTGLWRKFRLQPFPMILHITSKLEIMLLVNVAIMLTVQLVAEMPDIIEVDEGPTLPNEKWVWSLLWWYSKTFGCSCHRFYETWIVLYGVMNDRRVLRKSRFYHKVQSKALLQQPVITINGNFRLSPYVLGDSGYTMHKWLLMPYSINPSSSDLQVKFNEQHISGRIDIEQAFGVLKAGWQILSVGLRSNITWAA